MPASVIWGLLTLATVWYSKPDKTLYVPLGVFCGVTLTQGLNDLIPLTWGAVDLLALTGAFYLHERGNRAGFAIALILIARLFWHTWQHTTEGDLYTYYLVSNLLYGAILGAIAWNTYLSRR